MNTLWSEFLTNKGRPLQKWTHYFPIYERHFSRFRNHNVTLIEIGVAAGGSLQLWKRYFGPFAQIVGIDIDAGCKSAEEELIAVQIGDQSDATFLQHVVDELVHRTSSSTMAVITPSMSAQVSISFIHV